MNLEDLPEDFTPAQFMKLDRESLDKIDYQVRKWQCQCKGCKNFTKMRDYGISPFFMYHRNSKNSIQHPEKYWINLNLRYRLCSKHWDFIKRLEKSYNSDDVEMKLLDYQLSPLQKLI